MVLVVIVVDDGGIDVVNLVVGGVFDVVLVVVFDDEMFIWIVVVYEGDIGV